MGRPKGAKDKKPRKPRSDKGKRHTLQGILVAKKPAGEPIGPDNLSARSGAQRRRREREQKGEVVRRGRPPKILKCFGCPLNHDGWLRQQVRFKNKVPYCTEHYPAPKAVSHKCPDCGAEFDFFRWGGSVETTTVHCSTDACSFVGRAQDYYDDIDIKVIASPIESQEVTKNV